MFSHHAIARRVLDQTDAADRGFGAPRLDADQVDHVAVVIFVVKLDLPALDGHFPVEHFLAPHVLRAKARLLKPVGNRRVVAIARFVFDPQPHEVTPKE